MHECDVCGAEGERYTVAYPDGILALDRCEKHAKKLLALREEKGTWNANGSSRQAFKVSSLDDIAAARRRS